MSVLTREPVLKRLEQRINHVIPVKMQGILLALISTGLFVLVGVLVRILSERIDLFQILLFRQLVFIVLLLPSVKASIDILLKPRQVKLHFLRIFGAFLALYLGFVTVSHIPLADATALGFTQVLFVAVISRLFLSEAVGLSRLLTILIGFAGVMLVVQPEFNQSAVYTLTGLIAASGAAVAVVCVRKMAQTESRVVLLSYQAVFVGLIALLPSLMSWQWPTLYELMLLILVGVISSAAAQWIGVTAYKLAEANVIANVEYAKIVYSLALGYWLFAETPDTLAVLGVLIIFASAILPLLMTFLSVRRFSSNQPPV